MAWDSAHTAQLIGGYQSMAMQSMAHSHQIGLSGMPGVAADQMMGGAMNRMQGMGAPLMMGGMALAGLDPVSLGLKAAGTGWKAGGLMGAGIAGMGAFGVASGGMMLAQYAGNQMFEGASQQQHLNAAMRSSFNFRNPQGGQGFNTGQMGQIGSMMRHMTHETGPGGQVMGMGELTTLASSMGRMGMGNGIKDVQEFGKKFRELVQTAKTMAQDLGTTVQEATQMMASLKNSGVFKQADQLRFSGGAKSMAFAGNLALSEVTAMSNIGSQISRSVGGLGRQGAFAGMNTIGQIGVAQQMNVISDNDIYNATGMHGAEGRQALATSSLQQSGRFLQSKKGRWTLASLAGEDGTLNESAVAQLMGGGMSVGESRASAGRNLSGIGRANFLRNEGRLRGAAMEKIGGFLPAIQLQQWAQGRGVDVNNMDDRSMLFAQRHLGMGRDELDIAVKMANNMPNIMEQMNSSKFEQKFQDQLGQRRQEVGLTGIKRRFSQSREKVQGSLQKIGQEFFQEGSQMVESWINGVTGSYEQQFSKELEAAYRASAHGVGRDSFRDRVKGAQNLKSANAANVQSVFGSRNGPDFFSGFGDDRTSMLGNMFGNHGALAVGADFLLRGKSQASKFKDAGYDMSAAQFVDPIQQGQAIQKRMSEIQSIQRAASEPPKEEYLALGTSNAKWLSEMFASKELGGLRGEDRQDAIGAQIMKGKDENLKKVWRGASKQERARITSSLRGAAEGGSDAVAVSEAMKAEAAMYAAPNTSIFASGMSADDRDKAVMGSLGYEGPTTMGGSMLKGAGWGAAIGTAIMPILGTAIGAGIGSGVGMMKYSSDGKGGVMKATASALQSEESMSLLRGLVSEDKKTRASTMRTVNREMSKLRDKGGKDGSGLDDTQKGRLDSLEYLKVTAALNEAKTPEERAAVAAEFKMKPEQAERIYETVGAIARHSADQHNISQGQKVGAAAQEEINTLSKGGVAKFTDRGVTLSSGYQELMSKNKDVRKYMEGRMGALLEKSKLANVSNGADAQAGILRANDREDELTTDLYRMSGETRAALARTAGNDGDYSNQTQINAVSQRVNRFKRTAGRKGVYNAVADGLGLDLTRDQQRTMFRSGATDKDREKVSSFYTQELGLEGEQAKDAKEAIAKAMAAAHKGNHGEAARLMQGVESMPGVAEKKKEREDKKNEMQADPGSKLVAKAIGTMEGRVVAQLSEVVIAIHESKPDTEE